MEKEININETEYNLLGILNNMRHVPYHRTAELIRFEEQIYAEISKSPENIVGLIVLFQNQIMQGNRPKAIGLAHKIWSIGGEIEDIIEEVYINGLLSLGLLDMASVLLKSRFEKISDNINIFESVLIKFSIQTGNMILLEKIMSYDHADQRALFANFIDAYNKLQYAPHFKNIQKTVLSSVKETLASYEYNLYFDRGFTDLEVVLYLTLEAYEVKKKEEEIDKKIDAYCLSAGVKRLHNYQVVVKSIAEHPAQDSSIETAAEHAQEDNTAKEWGL